MLKLLYCEDLTKAALAFQTVFEQHPRLPQLMSFSMDEDWVQDFSSLEEKYPPDSDFPYDVVVTDIRFSVENDERRFEGLRFLQYIKENWKYVEVIVITSYIHEIPLHMVLGAMRAGQVRTLHESQWITRINEDTGDPGWDDLMNAIESAAKMAAEKKEVRARMAASPLFDVLVMSCDPLRLEVKKKSKGPAIKLNFEQPKAALVIRALCENAPYYCSPANIATRVRIILGVEEARRLNEKEIDWYITFNNIEPPCERKPAKVTACDFNPFSMPDAQRKYIEHPCAEMPMCPYDIMFWPISRKSFDGLRTDRFIEENVKTHIYQIKNRIAQAVEGRADAVMWRESLVQGRAGIGYALAADVEWID